MPVNLCFLNLICGSFCMIFLSYKISHTPKQTDPILESVYIHQSTSRYMIGSDHIKAVVFYKTLSNTIVQSCKPTSSLAKTISKVNKMLLTLSIMWTPWHGQRSFNYACRKAKLTVNVFVKRVKSTCFRRTDHYGHLNKTKFLGWRQRYNTTLELKSQVLKPTTMYEFWDRFSDNKEKK